MPEEALDSYTNDNDDITSITRSVPEEFYEPDLVRVVWGGDGASRLCSDEWQDSRNKQKKSQKCQSSEKRWWTIAILLVSTTFLAFW